jgi:S1-C subfamily serine protease
VLDRAKDATVYIKLKASGKMRSAGSGFVIKAKGDALLVMTNRHVAVPDEGDLPPGVNPEISVVLRSGTAQEQEVPARLVTYDERPAHDLALLEVKGVRVPPQPISAEKTASESDFFETMPAFSLGFPLGGLIVGNLNSNPAVTVNQMTISSFRRNENNRLERIQFAGSMIQGNSGGPIVDGKGLLVGIVVERLNGENVGMAIPPNVVASFLAGGVDRIWGKLESWSGNSAKVQVAARLVDPLGKIGGMSLRYGRQSPSAAPIKPDALGNWPQIAGGTNVPMRIANGSGVADFDLSAATPDDRKVLLQILVTDSLGRASAGRPIPASLPDKPGPLQGIEKFSTPRTLAHWSCEANLAEGIKMTHSPGATIIDLPGGVPINNAPQYNLFNAPCALIRAEGDFIATVGVENTFDPGGEGIVVPTGKKLPFSFQSAGILIWQDEKNFVRLERSKGSDGKISMLNRILVEVYKNGREAAVHYIDVPEQPVVLVAVRKGGSLRLLFALPPKQLAVFHEMAVDFNKDVFVGLAAANLSKRPFQAKLVNFSLKTPEGGEIVAKPFKMTKLVDSGVVKLPDGTRVFEGAGLKVSNPENAPVAPTDMEGYKGEWSDNRQLVWNNDKAGQALTLGLPVDADGKYEIKAKFTLAPDYAIAKLDIDGRPLYKGEKIDFYAQEIRPTKLMALGTFSLNKGKHKLTITVFNKNPKSSGYHFGLDEIQLVPTK